MKTIKIGGVNVPIMGMGTWYLGEGNAAQSEQEAAALKYGLNHGLTVIDTAEMYGNGAAESMIGSFLGDYDRANIYLISKFYPSHADKRQMRTALKNSLKRLRTDYLDLYLLHWRGSTPLAETLEGLQDLQKEGLIKQYGVSNFDVDDMDQLTLEPGGDQIAANEVLYNLQSRGIEYDLLPQQKQGNITTIGYSPFGSGSGKSIKLPPELRTLAKEKNISTHQLMLAWVLRHGDVLTIPRSGEASHMAENIAAADVTFSPDELTLFEQAFPAPRHHIPLEMI
ncbi:aldo/keto reductase [Lacticaseibacillus paracasei]|uniref:Aldo/keto reductase n=1 Tax=Lacticaseibacillus paracasei TaxID=1597 RepID=A0AAW6A3P2_LACPA|nr:aldo/keto reductase [Lacticaseibacillus paracasei]MDB1564293.1 aldo/keto reductase [Lacticaseibacillus paracasei]